MFPKIELQLTYHTYYPNIDIVFNYNPVHYNQNLLIILTNIKTNRNWSFTYTIQQTKIIKILQIPYGDYKLEISPINDINDIKMDYSIIAQGQTINKQQITNTNNEILFTLFEPELTKNICN